MSTSTFVSNIVWGNGLNININQIKIIQKGMIRNINRTTSREHTEKLFKKMKF